MALGLSLVGIDLCSSGPRPQSPLYVLPNADIVHGASLALNNYSGMVVYRLRRRMQTGLALRNDHEAKQTRNIVAQRLFRLVSRRMYINCGMDRFSDIFVPNRMSGSGHVT